MLNRGITIKINWVLDNILPPLLRDTKWFMKPLMRTALGKNHKYYMDFKRDSGIIAPDTLRQYYIDATDENPRLTDLNDKSVDMIMLELEKYSPDTKVLDIACGRGFLAKKIAEAGKEVTGADFILDQSLLQIPGISEYREADIERLPFEDRQFEVVISTHTLEHCQNLGNAISELRRVCAKQLIIVVPRQREYLYTFDFHVNFFPYMESFFRVMKNPVGICQDAGGDIFYTEYILP